ncbi:MAG: helix-turn-helix domain-containing protein [Fibrobacteria bacterium]
MLVLRYSQRDMKVIKPFFLGVLGGLALALALLVGTYFTSLRNDLYFALDPEMADVRVKLGQFQDWLAQADLRIAEIGSSGGDAPDSLRNAQTKAWRDYKAWRNRLGELARAHDKPTAEGFWPWTFSLRYWFPPFAGILALLPGLFLGFRARSRFRPGRVKAPQRNARAQALANFEDAIKKVARISETGRDAVPPFPSSEPYQGEPTPLETDLPHALPRGYSRPPPPREAASLSESQESDIPLIEIAPSGPVIVQVPPMSGPLPQEQPKPEVLREPEARDAGRETAFFQVGAPWGEPAGERIGNPQPPVAPPGGKPPGPPPGSGKGVNGVRGLSMEDEDAPKASAQAADEEAAEEETEGYGVMPPTTEVERIERRKEEVLKLARKGMTSSEISRRMRISQDQVEFIIRLRREKG